MCQAIDGIVLRTARGKLGQLQLDSIHIAQQSGERPIGVALVVAGRCTECRRLELSDES